MPNRDAINNNFLVTHPVFHIQLTLAGAQDIQYSGFRNHFFDRLMQIVIVKTQAQGLSRGLVDHRDIAIFIDRDDTLANGTQDRASFFKHASDLMRLQSKNRPFETTGQQYRRQNTKDHQDSVGCNNDRTLIGDHLVDVLIQVTHGDDTDDVFVGV